jgi:hypothetical protein
MITGDSTSGFRQEGSRSMKRILLGLIAAALIVAATTPAWAHEGGYPRGYRAGYYAGRAPVYGPYCGGAYHPRRVYYPVYPVAPVYPVYPRSGFSYYSPNFSFSIGQ